MDWAGLATFIAAAAAAFLSGASLLSSGRLEDRRWRREVLVETMIKLFDNSFESTYGAAFRARRDGEDLSWHKERALEATAMEMRLLTRLRLLAKPSVVERAVELHRIEDELYDAVFKKGVLPNADHIEALQDQRREARNRLFDAARRNLGLRRAQPIDAFHWKGPTEPDLVRYQMKRQQAGHAESSDDSNNGLDRRRPLAGRRRKS
jgi:hypothetical protein